MSIGDRIYALRKQKGLTMTELSKKCGFLINPIERDEKAPTAGQIDKICSVLGVSVEHLLPSVESKQAQESIRVDFEYPYGQRSTGDLDVVVARIHLDSIGFVITGVGINVDDALDNAKKKLQKLRAEVSLNSFSIVFEDQEGN